MEKSKNNRWIDLSEEEIKKSKTIAAKIVSAVSSDVKIYKSILYRLFTALSSKSATQLDFELTELLIEFDSSHNYTHTIPYATESTEISNNIFSFIANELSNHLGLTKGKGVVFTPSLLSNDMVRLALAEWLYTNHGIPFMNCCKIVWGSLECNPSIQKVIQDVIWYDPCIGCGVFELSIIQMYISLGIKQPPIIVGCEINPLFLQVAELRCKQLMDTYWSNYNTEPLRFSETNAILSPSRTMQYDIAIANPPYVSSSEQSKSDKTLYHKALPEMKSSTNDLYSYFIASSIKALKSKGILCFITPAQFQKSTYGKDIRKLIHSYCSVLSVFDFNELPVFDGVSIHTIVFSLVKDSYYGDLLCYNYQTLPNSTPLLFGTRNALSIPQSNISINEWQTHNLFSSQVLSQMSIGCTPLNEYCGKVYSGIRPELKEAYIIDASKKNELVESGVNCIYPMILSKKMRTWGFSSSEFFILVKKDEVIEESSLLYEHFLEYKTLLESRTSRDNWYALRACSYYDKMLKPKIIFPDIATEPRFSMDLGSHVITDGAYFIPQEDYFLLGILNSSLAKYYFKEKCASIGNPEIGGRMRFKKAYVETFPIPQATDSQKKSIAKLAKLATLNHNLSEKDASTLDTLVYNLYGINADLVSKIMEVI